MNWRCRSIRQATKGMLLKGLSRSPEGAATFRGAVIIKPATLARFRMNEKITVVSGLGCKGSLQCLNA